jgi:serine/threonine protein kinase
MALTQLGRYEITGLLGRGAMGVVYQARDPLIERTVAVKAVACGALPEKEAADFEQRFFREAKSAGRLKHPNIVTIHDVGRDGELAWIAMEFLEGRSLREVLDAGAPLTIERIVEIVTSVADALAYAHAQGIVHRDVKPANIMLLEDGGVKIMDFGIAHLPGGSLTLAGSVLGSPKYMSPEQVAGEKIDARADIFSLGSVLYEMLVGVPPFAGDNMHATMYQVVHKEPPSPSSCTRGVPPELDAVVAKAMAKDPAHRHANAAEFATDLRRAIDVPAATLPAPLQEATRQPSGSPHAAQREFPKTLIVFGGLAVIAVVAFLALRPPAPPSIGDTTVTGADTGPAATPVQKPASPTTATAAPASAAANKPPAETSANSTSPAKAGPAAKGWKSALYADLKICEAESVFSRVVCIEKARWKHCPGHWGEIPDCPSATAEKR